MVQPLEIRFLRAEYFDKLEDSVCGVIARNRIHCREEPAVNPDRMNWYG